jgi:Holliday junction resolvasome RuvABC endonuclease subunit
MNKETITLGIDASTTNIGLAFYINGVFDRTKNIVFKGTFDLTKLELIVKTISTLLDHTKVDFIILEEPVVPVGFHKNMIIVMKLNQVAGAICAVAMMKGVYIQYMHNQTAKSAFGVKHKDAAGKLMVNKYPVLADATEHEKDAVLLVEAYNKLYVSN